MRFLTCIFAFFALIVGVSLSADNSFYLHRMNKILGTLEEVEPFYSKVEKWIHAAKAHEDSHRLLNKLTLEDSFKNSINASKETAKALKRIRAGDTSREAQEALDLGYSKFLQYHKVMRKAFTDFENRNYRRNGLIVDMDQRITAIEKDFEERNSRLHPVLAEIKKQPSSGLKNQVINRFNEFMTFLDKVRDSRIEVIKRNAEAELWALGFQVHITDPRVDILDETHVDAEEQRWIGLLKDSILRLDRQQRK